MLPPQRCGGVVECSPGSGGDMPITPMKGADRTRRSPRCHPLPVLATELPERERLLVAVQLRRDLGRDVARLQPPLGVPDSDRIGVVLVLRLADEDEPPPGCEALVLQRIRPVRGPRELHDPN